MTASLLGVRTWDGLKSVLCAIDTYARCAQESYLKGKDDFIADHPFDADRLCAGDMTTSYMAPPVGGIFPLTAGMYDRLMHSSVYGSSLSHTNPRLYHLFCLYNRKYYKRVSTDAGLMSELAGFEERFPEYARLYAAYYAYYLYEYFLQIYEDYSFIKHTRIGVIHLSMILMFGILYSLRYGALTEEDFAHILSVYNRRAYFNDTVIDDMYDVFYENLIT